MNSRLLINLVLLVVIAVLGLVAYLKPGKEEAETVPLLTLDTQSLKRIGLQNKTSMAFEKDVTGVWRLSSPFAAPVNSIRIGQLLDIAKANSEARYPVKSDELAQFGLDRPEATLTLGDTVLQFGGTDPINMRRYVRLGDTLHLVDDSFFHHLTASAVDYVDKKLLPEDARIQRIGLPGVAFSRGADGQWKSEPVADGKTDPAELASAWATARAIEVKHLEAVPVGDVLSIALSEGEPIEFVIVQRQPALLLARKDLLLQYEITSDVARELLNQPAPEASPPSTPGKPQSTSGTSPGYHEDDADEPDEAAESVEDDHEDAADHD